MLGQEKINPLVLITHPTLLKSSHIQLFITVCKTVDFLPILPNFRIKSCSVAIEDGPTTVQHLGYVPYIIKVVIRATRHAGAQGLQSN